MPYAAFCEEEEGKEDYDEEHVRVVLYARDIKRIMGEWYYAVSAFGLENVLFSVGDNPELVGIYYEEAGEIRGLSWEEE